VYEFHTIHLSGCRKSWQKTGEAVPLQQLTKTGKGFKAFALTGRKVASINTQGVALG